MSKEVRDVTFEQAFGELETTVQRLEAGDLTLEETITNQTADSTLEPPWMPERWIVTDGQREWEETYAWQWGKEEGGAYDQPAIGPGATASWTWLCYPLPQGAWVKAADFTAWGHTYRFEFPKPAPGEFNYHDCP
jgi:hypothetical protein